MGFPPRRGEDARPKLEYARCGRARSPKPLGSWASRAVPAPLHNNHEDHRLARPAINAVASVTIAAWLPIRHADRRHDSRPRFPTRPEIGQTLAGSVRR